MPPPPRPKPPRPPRRLVFGEPASIAYRVSYEAYLDELEAAEEEQELYERMSDAQFHRWQRHREEAYPPGEEVTAALRDAIATNGHDKTKKAIVAGVREVLARRYPQVARRYVVAMFETLEALGHIRREAGRFRWSEEPRIRLPERL